MKKKVKKFQLQITIYYTLYNGKKLVVKLKFKKLKGIAVVCERDFVWGYLTFTRTEDELNVRNSGQANPLVFRIYSINTKGFLCCQKNLKTH